MLQGFKRDTSVDGVPKMDPLYLDVPKAAAAQVGAGKANESSMSNDLSGLENVISSPSNHLLQTPLGTEQTNILQQEVELEATRAQYRTEVVKEVRCSIFHSACGTSQHAVQQPGRHARHAARWLCIDM
jgi:hypothetical protein